MADEVFDLQANLQREYREISRTSFWVAFMARVIARRDMELKTLKSASVERIPATQGKVAAYEYVMALPDKLAKGEKED